MKKSGLSLIELLVVLTIIGILATLAIPSYQSYLMETRRQDAIQSIRTMQMEVEAYIAQEGTTPSVSDFPAIDSEQSLYTITYIKQSDDNYKIQADAKAGSSQSGDTGCTTIYITNKLDSTYPYECN